jgi:hypothetical protein
MRSMRSRRFASCRRTGRSPTLRSSRSTRGYISGLRARVAELKRDGKSSDEAADLLRGEFRAKYPDWGQPLRVVAAVNAIYAEVP